MTNFSPYLGGCIMDEANAALADELVLSSEYPRAGRYSDFAEPVEWEGGLHLPYRKFESLDPSSFLLEQTGPDCTAFAAWMAYDATRSQEIAKGEREQYYKRTATEPIYAQRGGSHKGMAPSLAAQWLHDFGGVSCEKYDSCDLTTYNHAIGAGWWRKTPSDVVTAAKKHPAKFIALCESADDLAAGLASGLCAFSGGQEGFSSTRDSDGFARREGKWNHCMPILAADHKSPRTGFLLWTWGNWNNGGSPKWAGEKGLPAGSFMASWGVIDTRIKKYKSTWLVGDVVGWKQSEVFRRTAKDVLG